MKYAKIRSQELKAKLHSPEARFYLFVSFCCIVFFLGGGSRDDVQSLVLLRPLAILFCAYALSGRVSGQWNGRNFPLYIVCALAGLMLMQLMPLPPSLWTELPGRQMFANIAQVAGIDDPWRPMSLAPSRTLNSLFSLAVPAAAAMLFLNLDGQYRRKAIPVLIVLIVISAMWAMFQLAGPPRGPLYLYRITNVGAGVGLFANRNHQAVALASAIVMIGWYAGSLAPGSKLLMLKLFASIATIFVLVPLILVTGSRAGLLLLMPGLAFAFIFIYFGQLPSDRKSRGSGRKQKNRMLLLRRWGALSAILAIVGISGLSVLLSRSAAYDRLFGINDLTELRFQLLPTIFQMIKEYMPWGSGFGSFEYVYKIYEPRELLDPSYLNQAHNDWLQYPLEGGLPALAIAFVAIIWFARRSVEMVKSWRVSSHRNFRAIMCMAVIGFLLAASIGDYPLRVPSLMVVFIILVCVFNDSIRMTGGQKDAA